jgi:hypothetical protein
MYYCGSVGAGSVPPTPTPSMFASIAMIPHTATIRKSARIEYVIPEIASFLVSGFVVPWKINLTRKYKNPITPRPIANVQGG